MRVVVVFAKAHLDRLFAGARAIDMEIGSTRGQLMEAIEQTSSANGMADGRRIGDTLPGVVTGRIAHLYQEHVQRAASGRA